MKIHAANFLNPHAGQPVAQTSGIMGGETKAAATG